MVLINSNFKITVPTGSLISTAKFLKYSYKKTNTSRSIIKVIKSFFKYTIPMGWQN